MKGTFIAEMRETKEIIVLCEDGPIELYRSIMSNFEGGGHIGRFAIYKNDVLIEEKILPKEKPMVKGRGK